MRAWRSVVVLAAAVLVLPSAAGASSSRGVGGETTKLFLHIDVAKEGTGDADFEIKMTLDDYLDGANKTGSVFDGAPNEIFLATGARDTATTVFPAREGLPLRLDANHPITGVIAMSTLRVNTLTSYVDAGAGLTTLELTLSGKLASGRKVTIGTQSIDYLVTPAQSTYPLEVAIQPSTDLDGARLTSLRLKTFVRGPSAASGFFELDDPASFIEIPTL